MTAADAGAANVSALDDSLAAAFEAKVAALTASLAGVAGAAPMSTLESLAGTARVSLSCAALLGAADGTAGKRARFASSRFAVRTDEGAERVEGRSCGTAGATGSAIDASAAATATSGTRVGISHSRRSGASIPPLPHGKPKPGTPSCWPPNVKCNSSE